MACYLARPGFIERLSPKARERLEGICPPKALEAGHVLFSAGGPVDRLFVVLEGQVKLSRLDAWGRERILWIAGRGDLLGTRFLDPDARHRLEAVCLGTTVVCPIGRDQMRRVMREVPEVVEVLCNVLVERLDHLERQLELAAAPATIRIASALLWLEARFGIERGQGWREIDLNLRQEDLAALAGTNRVTVTKALGELRTKGLVEGTRGRYRLKRDALRAYLQNPA